jgi:hypothetical protein
MLPDIRRLSYYIPFVKINSRQTMTVDNISNAFSSFENLKSFLKGDEAIQNVIALKGKMPKLSNRWLVKTLNKPSAIAQEKICNHPPIPFNTITDPKIKKRVFAFDDRVYFARNSISRGVSKWFTYLYFSTLGTFKDPREHLMAVAKQFEKGGGTEAVLIHSINQKKGKILNLKIEEDFLNLTLPMLKKMSSNETTQKLSSLANGVYGIHFLAHQCVYIKINQEMSFYFDPSEGLFELRGAEELLTVLKEQKKAYEAAYDPQTPVRFSRITWR